MISVEARRDEVVAQGDAVALRVALDVVADGVEPRLDAREQLDVPALRDQIGAVDAHALGLRLLVEQVHVGDERVGLRLSGKRVALGPESRRGRRRSWAGRRIPASAWGESVPSKS